MWFEWMTTFIQIRRGLEKCTVHKTKLIDNRILHRLCIISKATAWEWMKANSVLNGWVTTPTSSTVMLVEKTKSKICKTPLCQICNWIKCYKNMKTSYNISLKTLFFTFDNIFLVKNLNRSVCSLKYNNRNTVNKAICIAECFNDNIKPIWVGSCSYRDVIKKLLIYVNHLIAHNYLHWKHSVSWKYCAYTYLQ